MPGSDGVPVAVLINLPLKAGSTVPVMVITTWLPVPAAISPVTETAFPVPVPPRVTAAAPLTLVVQLTFLICDGTLSVITNAFALLNPVFPAVMT
ncbi:hypothetical protein D3C71_1828810 [compost metagenome]